MRIALLCYHSCPLARLGEREAGGMSVYVRNLAQALARQGVQVDIFTRRHNVEDPQSEEIVKGVRAHPRRCRPVACRRVAGALPAGLCTRRERLRRG